MLAYQLDCDEVATFSEALFRSPPANAGYLYHDLDENVKWK